MKKRRNPLAQFMIGMVMLAAGLYWFLSNVSVSTYFGLSLWGFRFGAGLVVVPFIAGIIWLFLNVDSVGAKILTVLGIVIILASIISNIRFVFPPISTAPTITPGTVPVPPYAEAPPMKQEPMASIS